MMYTKTWRHSVMIEAESPKEAQDIWEALDLGDLEQAETEEQIYDHRFVEDLSFEDSDGVDIEE